MIKKTSSAFIKIFSLVLLACIGFGCENLLDKLTTFRIPYKTTIDIPKSGLSTLNIPLKITGAKVTTNSSKVFANNGTKAHLVKDVVLEKLVLTIQSPESQNFSFLSSIKIFIEAEGLQTIEIASYPDIPSDAGKVLELKSNNVKLDKYIKKDSFSISTEIVAREIPDNDISIETDMTFKVTADLI
jgi:hypothetical protein